MNSEKLQQLKEEITQKMIDGLQNQNFDKLLEKYDVLSQAKLKFQFSLDVDTVESSDARDIPDPDTMPQTWGWCVPCPADPNLTGCRCCC